MDCCGVDNGSRLLTGVLQSHAQLCKNREDGGGFRPFSAWRSWTAEHLIMPGIIEFPQGRPGRPGPVRRPLRQRVPAPPLRRVPHRPRSSPSARPSSASTTSSPRPPTSPASTASSPRPSGTSRPSTERRLERLQKDPSTRYSDQGVIPIDNTLIDRDGMLIPDAGWFWDHAEERNKIAQDYLFVNYVCTSGKHYPLEFRLFRKEEVCEALKEPFRNHTALVLRVDRLGVRAGDPRRLRLRLLLHQRRDPQPHPRQEGSVRATPGLRRRPEDQPQAGVEGPDHQGQRTGGLDPGGGPQGDADRRPAAVVLHGDGAHPRREAQGADRDPVAVPQRRASAARSW